MPFTVPGTWLSFGRYLLNDLMIVKNKLSVSNTITSLLQHSVWSLCLYWMRFLYSKEPWKRNILLFLTWVALFHTSCRSNSMLELNMELLECFFPSGKWCFPTSLEFYTCSEITILCPIHFGRILWLFFVASVFIGYLRIQHAEFHRICMWGFPAMTVKGGLGPPTSASSTCFLKP